MIWAKVAETAFLIWLLTIGLNGGAEVYAAGGCTSRSGLPDEAKVYVAAAGPVQAGRGPSSHFSAPVARVMVEEPGARVILLLSAYYRHRWEITAGHDTTIAAIFLTGYEDQEIRFPPPGVTLIKSSREKEGECRPFFIGRGYPGLILELQKAAQVSRTLFGRAPDGIFYDRSGRIDIKPGQKPERVFLKTPEETAAACLAHFNNRRSVSPGGEAWNPGQAVAQGQLRPASAYDFKNWLAQAAEANHIPASLLSDEFFRVANPYDESAYCYERSFVITSSDFSFYRMIQSPGRISFYLAPGLTVPEGFEYLPRSLLLLPGGKCRGDCLNVTREKKYESRGNIRFKETYQRPD